MSVSFVSSNCQSNKNYFEYLPDEIIVEIFKKLDLRTFASVIPLVCRNFERISKDNSLIEVFYPLAQACMQVFNLRIKPFECPSGFAGVEFSQLNPHEFVLSCVRITGFVIMGEFKTLRMDLRPNTLTPIEIDDIRYNKVIYNGMFYYRDEEGIKFFDPEAISKQTLFELPETPNKDLYLAKDCLVYSYKTPKNTLQLEAYNLLSKERKALTTYDATKPIRLECDSNSSLIVIVTSYNEYVVPVNAGKQIPIDVRTQLIVENELITKPTSSGHSLVPPGHFHNGEYFIWRGARGDYSMSSIRNPDLFPIGNILETGFGGIRNFHIDGKYLCARVKNQAGLIFTMIVNMETKKTVRINNKDTILAFFNGYIVTDKGVIDIKGNPSDSIMKKLFRRSLSLS